MAIPSTRTSAFPLTSREEAAEGQKAFARMVLDRDNQVVFSRIKGSLPVRTDVDPSGLDRCGRLGLQMIAEKKGEVSAQSMPTQLSDGWIRRPSCLIPVFDGAIFSQAWRDSLWDKFYTGAPARQRWSVERYSIVKRA
jgi:hypothetical protein